MPYNEGRRQIKTSKRLQRHVKTCKGFIYLTNLSKTLIIQEKSERNLMESKREALRQSWISQGLDRFKVSASVPELLSIVSQIDSKIARLSDEDVDYYL